MKQNEQENIKTVGRGLVSRRNERFEFLHGGSKPPPYGVFINLLKFPSNSRFFIHNTMLGSLRSL